VTIMSRLSRPTW